MVLCCPWRHHSQSHGAGWRPRDGGMVLQRLSVIMVFDVMWPHVGCEGRMVFITQPLEPLLVYPPPHQKPFHTFGSQTHTTPVLTQHPPHSKHHPHLLSLTFPHTILPHVKVLVKQFLALLLLVPRRRGIVVQCFCSLFVPMPLLWATRPHAAPVGYSYPYRSCGLLGCSRQHSSPVLGLRSMVDHRVTRFQLARRPQRIWGKGMEPALVMLVVMESSSDDEEDVSRVLSSLSWSCHSLVLVGGIATPALARPEGPCWKLASCWSRPSTRHC